MQTIKNGANPLRLDPFYRSGMAYGFPLLDAADAADAAAVAAGFVVVDAGRPTLSSAETTIVTPGFSHPVPMQNVFIGSRHTVAAIVARSSCDLGSGIDSSSWAVMSLSFMVTE